MPTADLSPPSIHSPFQKLGGEAGVRALAQRFFQLMDELPEAWAVRHRHPEDLSACEQHLHDYLCDWLGGPPLPDADRPLHRPPQKPASTVIDPQLRDEWLLCMRLALAERVQDQSFRIALQMAFEQMADQVIQQTGHHG